MSDGNEGKKVKGFDISKLATADANFQKQSAEITKQFEAANPNFKSLQDAIDNSGVMSATKAMQSALDNNGVSAAMEAAKGITANLDPLREHASAMATAAKLAAPAQDMMERLRATGVYDRLNGLSATAAEGSRLADAIRGIEKQQHSLDAMIDYEPVIPRLDHLNFENPIVETNRKLDRIEKQFSQISTIAHDSAQVATDLQAYAAEFLQKFERAADDANQSGTKAIKVGWLALAIAVVVGAGQIFAPTLIQDQEAALLHQTVVDLNTEISALRAEQSEANERLIEALRSSDQATATAIRDAIATFPSTSETVPEE